MPVLIPEAWLPAFVAITLLALFLAFAFEVRSPEVSALATVGVLLIFGAISSDDLLASLSNSAPLSIIGMFIVSAALVRTGLLDELARMVTKRAKEAPRRSVATLLVLITVMSAFTNNTPLVMMMVPVGVVLANQLGESSSKLLMPISFAAILGGTCTLIGTSTNLLVDGVAREAGMRPFTLFEIAPVGVVVALAGLGYLILARHLLPHRTTLADASGRDDAKRFTVSVVIDSQSPLIGKSLHASSALNRGTRRIVDLVRDGRSHYGTVDVTLQAADVVVLRCSAEELLTIKETGKLMLAGQEGDPDMPAARSKARRLIETLVLPSAQVIGHQISALALRERYGVVPIALHRKGSNLLERFEDVMLEAGDTILFEGEADALERLVEGESLLNLAEPKERGFRRQKAPIALAVLAAIVIGASFDVLPLPALVTLGVATVLVTHCIEPEEAFSAVDWRIIALIVAMLAIGTALENAGLVEIAVAAITPILGEFSPWVALAAIYLLSLALTEIVTNNAVAVVVTPVAIKLATAIGSDPRPFVIAVMFAASASFLTPIGYQTNTLVYGAGGYRFTDYPRFGFPLTIVVAIATLVIIPLVWPL